MTELHQDNQVEPFFITVEIEAELIAAGYEFEPPSHFATVRLPDVLARLTDVELAAWPTCELSKREIERRQRGAFKAE